MRNEQLQTKIDIRIKEVDNFKYLGNVLTKDCYCTREIKTRIPVAKEAFNRKISFLTNKVKH